MVLEGVTYPRQQWIALFTLDPIAKNKLTVDSFQKNKSGSTNDPDRSKETEQEEVLRIVMTSL